MHVVVLTLVTNDDTASSHNSMKKELVHIM